jgi:uncharacterized protein
MQQRQPGRFVFSPTDLVNFLGCHHASFLDRLSFSQALTPDDPSEGDRLIQHKGLAHEAAYLQHLKAQGKRVTQIPSDLPYADRLDLTEQAVKSGVEVIYQAALLVGQWAAYADFLIRTDMPSALGNFSYEVTDTKLARHPEAKHLIQLCVYSDLVASFQDVTPKMAHLVLGDGGRESFRVKDYVFYVRHAQRRLEAFGLSPPRDSYPLPCTHCRYCHWERACSAQWQKDDHLSLVANIQHAQLVKLEAAGIRTVAALAGLSQNTRIPNVNRLTLERLRHQAALQDYRRRTNQSKAEVIPCEPGCGFDRLPKPDAGDLFFDMEGDPLHPDGLEYLFGFCFMQDGQMVYKAFWAHDHGQERAAFGQFMTFLHAHLSDRPNAYIYHYNHYEPTALKRLAGRYAVAEHQLDDLLRRQKLVDLFKVVREAIRTSEPAYSLKNLETFYMDRRRGEVATAFDSIVVYNRWREDSDDRLLEDISAYNETDCRSTAKLREWLLTLRPSQTSWFDGPAPPDNAEKAAEKKAERQEQEAKFAECEERLRAAAPTQDDYRCRLADLLNFHQREARPKWWDYFARKDRFEDELLDDAECLAGLTLVKPPETVKQSLVHTYRYAAQETKRQAGDRVCDVALLKYAGTIEHLDEERCIVRIKRKKTLGPLPEKLSIGPEGLINTDVLRDALMRVAEDVLAGRGSYRAVTDILSKALPCIRGRRPHEPIAEGEDLLGASIEAVADLNQSYLFIQGPPGAGKTHTSAHVIVELIRRGKKVGVAANSHKAIHNLLDKIEEVAVQQGVEFVGVKKSTDDDSKYEGRFVHSEYRNEKIDLNARLLAGTAWLFADERFDRHLDYLFIDEAGQVALANVVAMGTAARNVVLVGDQMQLGQPVQGVHPGEAGLSSLDFLLGGQATVSPERGIFLDHSRRLHPAICQYISAAFYDGRLAPDPDNAKRTLVFGSPIDGIAPVGIHFVPVIHDGCSQKSEEEGVVIKEYFNRLLEQRFDDGTGSVRPMTPDDILVVSPYNVQVNYLRSILPAGARVGTVDKFQGQEAPVVLVSMTTSSAEDMPRNIDFLFSANRLNVALSRAQSLAVVVASPKLLETPCRSIEHMRLVNKFCQLADFVADRPG